MFRPFRFYKITFYSLCVVMLIYAVHNVALYLSYETIDRDLQLKLIDASIRSNIIGHEACRRPNLSVNDPEMMSFVKEIPPLDCSLGEPPWVECEQICRVTRQAKTKYGNITCAFVDILRQDDFEHQFGKIYYSQHEYMLQDSDVVKVFCNNKDGTVKWSGTLTGIRNDLAVHTASNWNHVPEEAMGLNVLIFGFDSLSKNTFIRKLPKSYEALKKLNSVILQGYNIVGDGTPQALIPMLTGQTELELPDTRLRMGKKAKFVDVYPFIWNNFRNAGYVTAFLEDVPHIGTFTYRLKGFYKQPTDHYMRTYYVASADENSRHPEFCTGNSPRHKVMLNYAKQFMSTYSEKPRFMFGFHGELSHDSYNLIGVIDDDFATWINDLHDSGLLNNTMLVIMSDHGPRFVNVRNTLQGKQEERMPFFSVTMPPKFKKKHFNLYENLKKNADRLLTPFDIHSTLLSVLDTTRINKIINKRSLSIFGEVPSNRSCADAYIEPHWCACLNWRSVSVDSATVKKATEALINLINSYTHKYRNMCEKLYLQSIEWAAKLVPHENLVNFKKSKDYDGFSADLNGRTVINHEIYQIKVILEPGNNIYEASLSYDINADIIKGKISDISRINKYGSQAKCVNENMPDLRKYCYCHQIA